MNRVARAAGQAAAVAVEPPPRTKGGGGASTNASLGLSLCASKAGVRRRAGRGAVARLLAAHGDALGHAVLVDSHGGFRHLARAAADVGARSRASVVLINAEPWVGADLEATAHRSGDDRRHAARGDGCRDRVG